MAYVNYVVNHETNVSMRVPLAVFGTLVLTSRPQRNVDVYYFAV